MFGIKKLRELVFSCLLVFCVLFHFPSESQGSLQTIELDDGNEAIRSLESLRDLDYQTWQVVVYPAFERKDDLTLRIIGYPGDLRIDHPTYLKVHSGIRDWALVDTTLLNRKLMNDPREAAAEFDLTPLVLDLKNNRPLRFSLKGVFTDLPIPPYLVSEWRSLDNSTVD